MYYNTQRSSKFVNCIIFIPHLNIILSVSTDNTIKIWDLLKYKFIKTLAGHNKNVNVICDSTIRTWDFITGKNLKIINVHNKGINEICFDKTMKYLFSVAIDKSIKILETETMNCIKTINENECFFSVYFDSNTY